MTKPSFDRGCNELSEIPSVVVSFNVRLRLFKFLPIALLVFLPTCVAAAQNTDEDDSVVEIFAAVTIESSSIDRTNLDFAEQGFASWQAVANLGNLEGGTEYSLTLKVKSDEHLSFDTYKANCRCNKLNIASKEFTPQKEVAVTVSFKTPEGNSTGKSALTLNFMKQDIETGQIAIQYSLSNSLFFESSQSHSLPAKESKLRIPLYFTAPVAFEHLEANWKSPQKDDVVVEVKKEINSCFVELTVPASRTTSFLSGELSVFDTVTEANCEGAVMVNFLNDITIIPRVIRFSKVEVADSDCVYEASALVRVNHSNNRDQKDGSASNGELVIETIDATIDHASLRISKKKLANGIWRLTIRGNKDLVESAVKRESQIDWGIKCNEAQFSCVSLVSIERN
jgi:hypothetical protein